MFRILVVLALLCSFTLSFAQLTLLKDINTQLNARNSGINPIELTPANGRMFFSGRSGLGQELWKYENGEPILVKDIYPGTGSSNPYDLVEAGGLVYFLVEDDGLHGLSLWRSDGTEQGTFFLKDINEFDQAVISLHSALNMLYMTSTLVNTELWRSDGTIEGTILLHSQAKSSPVEFNGSIYFGVQNETALELWKSDGTVEGSAFLKNIFTGPESIFPMMSVVASDKFYFVATPDNWLSQVWVSDGTADGTTRVPGDYYYVDYCLKYHDMLLFHTTGEFDHGIWRTDGTQQGTTFCGFDDPGEKAVVKGDDLYFIGWNSTNNLKYELRRWNPTTENLSQLTTELATDNFADMSEPGLIEHNGMLLFRAPDPDGTRGILQVWHSDGTDAGTYPITDYPERNPTFHFSTLLTPFDGFVYFPADDNVNGIELWRTDGSIEGTLPVSDRAAGTHTATVSGVVELNGKVYFGGDDGVHGHELMVTDGTAPGTHLLKDLAPWSSSYPKDFIKGKNNLFFTAYSDPLTWTLAFFKTDGTEEGTVKMHDVIPYSTIHHGNTLFLTLDLSATGHELYKSEYPYNSIELVKDINPGPIGTSMTNFLALGSSVYFISGTSIWKTDGSNAGTVEVVDTGLPMSQMMVAGNTLYFTAGIDITKQHLWKSDLASGQTGKIKEFPTGTPHLKGSAGKCMYLTSYDANMGGELWRTDGTEEGTLMLKKINPDYFKLVKSKFCAAGDIMFFTADDGIHGTELWTSDGTPEGTHMSADINPGEYSSTPLKLIASGTSIYFTAYDNNMQSLYKTNGTTCGLVKLSEGVEAAHDNYSPTDGNFEINRISTLINNTIYIEGYTPETDWEIFLHDVADDPVLAEECRAAQTITFNPEDRAVDDDPFELSAFATSLLTVSFSTESDKITLTDNTVTPVKAGRVTVTASQNGDGWTLPAEVERSFCINPSRPSIILITSTEGTTLTADAESTTVDGYEWYFNNEKIAGESDAQLTATESGTYTCRTFVEDCMSESSESANVIIAGIESDDAVPFEIYPNPGAESVIMQLPKGLKKVSIMDAVGKPVSNFETTETTYALSVSDLPLGVYIFRIHNKGNSGYARFVKK